MAYSLGPDEMKTPSSTIEMEVVLMYVGLDVHKRYCYATVIDSNGWIMWWS